MAQAAGRNRRLLNQILSFTAIAPLQTRFNCGVLYEWAIACLKQAQGAFPSIYPWSGKSCSKKRALEDGAIALSGITTPFTRCE